jgi:hypothetical protein
MTEHRHPTLSEISRHCDKILDNLYNGSTQKAEVLKKQEEYLKKETPEEYKARKEQQAQRKVKKETPEEYAARIEYMKRKEKVDLEVETQRLFDKAEKEHKKHQDYLRRQADREERESARYEMELKYQEREAEREEIREAYKKTPEGRLEQFRTDERKAEKAEKTRNWNTPGAINERKKNQEEWDKHQQNHLDSYVARCEHKYKNKDKIRGTHFNTGKWEDKVDSNYKHAMSLR